MMKFIYLVTSAYFSMTMLVVSADIRQDRGISVKNKPGDKIIMQWIDAIGKGRIRKEVGDMDPGDVKRELSVAQFKYIFPMARRGAVYPSHLWKKQRQLGDGFELWYAAIDRHIYQESMGYDPRDPLSYDPPVSSGGGDTWFIHCIFSKKTKKMVDFWIDFRHGNGE